MSDDRSLVVRFLQLPFRLQFSICKRAGLTDFDNTDEAMAAELFRRAGKDQEVMALIRIEVERAEESRKGKPPVCPVDAQQCDSECQARLDRACATETKTESVYERARKLVDGTCLPRSGYPDVEILSCDHGDQIMYALDRGEMAEKRAEEAERERDEARARADRLEQVLKAIGEHEEYDRCGCACVQSVARAALDPPKEG
jgi:hypothetical protein